VASWPAGDFAAGPNSGSYPMHGMVAIPASTAACAGIGLGLSKDDVSSSWAAQRTCSGANRAPSPRRP
jgi:3-polyprenyl-4-hydroxybenzoate decarboxylase